MSTPDFYSLLEPATESSPQQEEASPNFYQGVNLRGPVEKTLRKGAQYGIGLLERVAAPWDILSATAGSKGAQMANYREMLFDEIERLGQQKRSGNWSDQDENMLQNLINQIQNPEETEKYLKPIDISSGSLIEKGTKKLFDYDISPEDLGESAARLGGNLRVDKLISSGVKKGAALLTQEGRIASKWKSLEKAAKGNAEKQAIVDFSKQHGLSPQEATLIMREGSNIEKIAKLSKKTKKYKELASSLKEKLGSSYEELKSIGKKGGYLNPEEADLLKKDLTTVLEDIGRTYVEGPDTEAARKIIEKTIFNVENKAGTVEDLINGRRNLRQFSNWGKLHEGDAIKAKAEKALLDAIARKNPEVAKRLEQTDKAWAKFKKHQKALDKAENVPKYHGIPVPGALGALAFAGLGGLGLVGFKGAVTSLAVKEAFQRASTQLLTNPRLQGIRKKIIDSLSSGIISNQKGLLTAFLKIIKKEDPELHKDLEESLVAE